MPPYEHDVDRAIAGLSQIIEGAANSNHNAKVAAVRAFSADRLYAALKLIRPEIVHSIAAGDGRFTLSQVDAIDAALAAASGLHIPIQMAAE